MEPLVFITFVIATTIMIALPGPSVLLTVAHSISFGWKRAIATVAGATAGIAVQLLIAAIGLTSLLNSVALAFEWVRWAGAVYLVYLGIRQWRQADLSTAPDTLQVTKPKLFVQGVVITIPNPKSLVFIAGFLPQFIDTARPAGIQFACIVPTFLVITFTITSIWALAAGNVKSFVQNRHTFKFVLKAAGGLMVIAGVGLALSRR